jgi:hypothetical protein
MGGGFGVRAKVFLMLISSFWCSMPEASKLSVPVKKTASLKMSVEADKKKYAIKDVVKLKMIFKNVGKQNVYIYSAIDEGMGASVSFWIKDHTTKKDISTNFIAGGASPPPVSEMDFVSITAGREISRTFAIPLEDYEIPKGGRYEINAVYHSPTPAAWSFGLPIWSREMGELESTIVIEVD